MKIKSELIDLGEKFAGYLSVKEYGKAKELLINGIEHTRGALNNPSFPDEEKTELYYWAILFRGLIDYVCLVELVSKEQWALKNENVERAWELICDAKKRFGFCTGTIEGPSMEKARSFLASMEIFFLENFGSGYYSSPEILIKTTECSICGLDLIICEHIPGRIYAGKRCRSIAKDLELKAVSIVHNPHDPRCRIWPWHVKGADQIESCIIYAGAFDDFIMNDNWKADIE